MNTVMQAAENFLIHAWTFYVLYEMLVELESEIQNMEEDAFEYSLFT